MTKNDQKWPKKAFKKITSLVLSRIHVKVLTVY